MNKIKCNYFLLSMLSAFIFISACNNDIDLIDQYRETTIIYSLLNITDSIQYVRVEKAYLGEGNALLMAQQADSIYYDTADISLSILRTNNGILLDSIKLFPTSAITKEEGLFVDMPHLLYRTDGHVKLDAESVYQLVFNNKKSNHNVTAYSPAVKQMSLNPLIPSPLPDPSSSLNLADDDPLKISVVMPLNGKFLSLVIRINYTDSIIGTTTSRQKVLDYDQGVNVADNTNGGQKFEYLIDGQDFYRFIGSHITKENGIYHIASSFNLDFVFAVGAEEFYTYYIVNKSTSSISDNIPDYSNLSSGKGVFSSRSLKSFLGKRLNNASMDSLVNGQYTHGLFH